MEDNKTNDSLVERLKILNDVDVFEAFNAMKERAKSKMSEKTEEIKKERSKESFNFKRGYTISSPSKSKPSGRLYIPKIKIYKDNELITCHDGKEYIHSECVWIDGEYFHISDTKNVCLDCSNGKPIAKKYAGTVFTKIKIVDDKLETIEKGLISNDNSQYTIPFYSRKYSIEGAILNEQCIDGWDYRESISIGQLVDASDKESISVNDITHYDSFRNIYFDENLDEKTKLKMGIISPSFRITEGVKYSFGVEIECAKGFIPYWKANRFNISAIRDGSLNGGAGGPEYVTGILKGDTGMMHLQELCNELAPRTVIDKYCGIHTHIGGLDFSNKFLVNMYVLCQIIEQDMLSILPPSRRNNTYCRNLKSLKLNVALNSNSIQLKEDWLKLFEWVSFEQVINPTFKYNKSSQHPLGYKCGYNHSTPRYCWINFVPAVFKTREKLEYKTIEFRSGEGSTNFDKIRNWTLLCLAIVKFADKYPDSIDSKTNITSILTKIYPNKGQKLAEYFDERRMIFANPYFDEKEWYKNDNKNYNKNLKTIKELTTI